MLSEIFINLFRCMGLNCDYMGFYAFSNLNGSKPEDKSKMLFVMTAEQKPFCAYHYRVTIVLSDTYLAKRQGGDRYG